MALRFPIDFPNNTPVLLADQVLINASGTNTTSYSTVAQIFAAANMYVSGLFTSFSNTPFVPIVLLNTRTGTNALPANAGAVPSAGTNIRIEGGDNSVLDFGNDSTRPWLQSTDKTDLSINYRLLLNPNGGNVGIGTVAPEAQFHVLNAAVGTIAKYDFGGVLNRRLLFGINAGNVVTINSFNSAETIPTKLRLNDTGGQFSVGLAGIPVFANNAAAIGGGLVSGDFYRTGANPDPLCIVH